MAKLKSVFMGTPAFAVPSLNVLANETDLLLVVTQPDKRAGRGRKLEFSPVKRAALDLGVDIIQPQIIKGKKFASKIAGFCPDVIVTAAFGKLFKSSLLAVPRLGCINVHASILPYYRGAAPINWALINGERNAGVSIMKMEEGLDAGPVYQTSSLLIEPEDTTGSLTAKLADLGASTLSEVLASVETTKPVPQRHENASWAPILKKEDGLLSWEGSADTVFNHIRGMHPWPCAFFNFNGESIKVHQSEIIQAEGYFGVPGEVLEHTQLGIDVAAESGVVRLKEIQLPGKKKLSAHQFYAGKRFEIGSVLI